MVQKVGVRSRGETRSILSDSPTPASQRPNIMLTDSLTVRTVPIMSDHPILAPQRPDIRHTMPTDTLTVFNCRT